MLNQCILVGKVTDINKEEKTISIDIKRIRTEEFDKITCDITSVFSGVDEYLKVGSTVGVKARLVGDANKSIVIMAEKITFINTKNDEED